PPPVIYSRSLHDALPILKRGNREVLPFELVPHTFMREVWANFIDNAKGLPIWISWNQENFPTECIYGMWSQNKPRYVSPLFSSRSEEHTSELQSRENLVC